MPAGKSPHHAILEKVPIFAGLAPEEVAFLAARAVPRKFQAGELVFAEGEPCTGLWVV